jgi:hypothetical protein
MKINFQSQVISTFIICLLFISCQSQSQSPNLSESQPQAQIQSEAKSIHIPMFKGLKLYITKQQYDSFVDSLVNNDPVFSVVSDNGQFYCQFREVTDGYPYYGYLLPTFTYGILTKLTIYYLPFSIPAFVTQYVYREEPNLIPWGDSVNRFYNDLNIKLQIKYGTSIKSGNTVSRYPLVNYTYLFNEWNKGDLSVKLLQEVERDNGSNKFSTCNFLVEYSPTEEFQLQNKKLIDKTMRDNNSMY